MLRKKRSDRRKIYDEATIDIPVYTPQDLLCPDDYRISVISSEFEENFKALCNEWISKAKPDQFNAQYMDSLIGKVEAEAIQSVEMQSVDHQTALEKIWQIHRANKLKAEFRLEKIIKERSENRTEEERLTRIYYKGTAFEDNGRSKTYNEIIRKNECS